MAKAPIKPAQAEEPATDDTRAMLNEWVENVIAKGADPKCMIAVIPADDPRSAPQLLTMVPVDSDKTALGNLLVQVGWGIKKQAHPSQMRVAPKPPAAPAAAPAPPAPPPATPK